MRKAAEEAGINEKQLKIALEPEVASLYCQHVMTERAGGGLSVAKEGTKYMVIDLGGGTPDITVHEKLAYGKVREIHKATGGAWGGNAIDEGYLQFLNRLAGGPVMRRFRMEKTSDFLEMMREFEVAKRTVGPKEQDTFNVRIPPSFNEMCKKEIDEDIDSVITSPNSPFLGKLKRVGDKLLIESEIIKGIFKNVIDQIVDHEKEILMKEKVKNISMILMVGGFSESLLVQHVIREQFQTPQRRVVVPHEAGLTVVKGAVIFGHQPDVMESRVVRRTYGYNIKAKFIEGVHPESRKVPSNSGPKCKGVFSPFVTSGTSIKVGETVSKKLNLSSRETDKLILYYTDCPDIQCTNDPRCHKLFSVNLNDVLPSTAQNNQPMIYQFSFGETEVS